MQYARTLALAFTGASGMPYGLRLLECLLGAGTQVYLAYSPAAQVVAKQECGLVLPTQPREAALAVGALEISKPLKISKSRTRRFIL